MTEPIVLAFRTVRSSSGATVGVASAATFLALVSFTTPLATLPATSAALGSGPEGQAWILSSMSIGRGGALAGTVTRVARYEQLSDRGWM